MIAKKMILKFTIRGTTWSHELIIILDLRFIINFFHIETFPSLHFNALTWLQIFKLGIWSSQCKKMIWDPKAKSDEKLVNSKCRTYDEALGIQSGFKPQNTHLRVVTSKVRNTIPVHCQSCTVVVWQNSAKTYQIDCGFTSCALNESVSSN